MFIEKKKIKCTCLLDHDQGVLEIFRMLSASCRLAIVYSILEADNQQLTFQQLVEKTGFSSSQLSQQTDKLAKIGIVVKTDDVNDRRRKVIAIGSNDIARMASEICRVVSETACQEKISNLYYLSKRA